LKSIFPTVDGEILSMAARNKPTKLLISHGNNHEIGNVQNLSFVREPLLDLKKFSLVTQNLGTDQRFHFNPMKDLEFRIVQLEKPRLHIQSEVLFDSSVR
jgi:hypothetical protein